MSKDNLDLAVIIPVYNEGTVLKENFLEIRRVFIDDELSCSFVIVDDGSTDSTWLEISSLTDQFGEVSAIRFARNFGKEAAICAGLDKINSKRYLIMDSDLQHPPGCVKNMISLMEIGQVDIVDGVKAKRGKEPLCYRLVARTFYRLMKLLTGLELDNSSDFKLLSYRVVESLRRFEESSRFFRGLVAWVGFKQATYHFTVDDRIGGKTRFSLRKLIKLALNSILAHTAKPLYLTILAGTIFFLLSIILATQTLYNYFSGFSISGFTTVILLLLFIGSMIMISLGIIGVYISRIYDEVKKRPPYIVSESIGLK